MAISKSFAVVARDDVSDTVLTTATFDSTGFTHVAVFLKHEGATTTITPSDNKGSTGWTAQTKRDNRAVDSWGQFHWAKIGTPGTGHTVTMTLGAARPFRTIGVWLINASTTGEIKVDAESVAQSPSDTTAIDAGSLVTSGASVVSLMGVAEYAATTYTPGTGWVEDFDGVSPCFTYGQSRGSETTTPIDPVCTGAAAQDWAACAVAFAEATAAGNNIAAAGSLFITGAADLDATGALLAAGVLSITGAAALDAVGQLTAVGSLAITGVVDLTSAGANDLAAAGSLSVTGAASLTAFGALIASGNIVISGAAELTGAAVAEETFTGGFYLAFEREVKHRERERRKRKEEAEEAQAIQDQLDREIAALLHAQEARDAEQREIERLRSLVTRFADSVAEEAFAERVRQAFLRAAAQQNASALLTLDREMRRAMEEEELVVLMTIALDD